MNRDNTYFQGPINETPNPNNDKTIWAMIAIACWVLYIIYSVTYGY